MSTVIKVENISKQYRLGNVGTGSLSHDLNRTWHRMRGKEDPYLKIGEANDRAVKGTSEYVWALQDINFEVKQGEVLGIIGRNGAGKSTLLKILSRTTTPTTGQIKIKGRVASLLEVGTGFHPELTGRENIFLNGAILGMTKSEIKSKFDEIVDFAGVERYIDTPVKRYSSGMYVRLAFGVAAHLEPEILIVDEVLAVGDAEFQKKALGKMKDVSEKDGRTVLFVSHNIAAVKRLCTNGLLLENGFLKYSSSIIEVINNYQKRQKNLSSITYTNTIEQAIGNDNIKVLNFEIESSVKEAISISSGALIKLIFYNFKENINLDTTFELSTIDDIVIFHHGVLISENSNSKKGYYSVEANLSPNLLNAGVYKIKLIFGENQRHPLLVIDDALRFNVENESLGSNNSIMPGFIRPNLNFNVKFNQ